MEDRREICDLLNSQGLTGKGVEIGSFVGRYARHILDNWKGTLYLIDPWKEPPKNSDVGGSVNNVVNPETMLKATKTLKGVEDRAIMIRAFSHQVVDLFQDESLDFIYIDGDHSYKGAKQDIESWHPKIKKGGLMAGHDYLKLKKKGDWSIGPSHPNGKDKYIYCDSSYVGVFGVNPAVDEFVEKHDYELKVTTESYFGTWYFLK